MTRLNILLLIAVVASAMALVRTAQENRRLTHELFRAEGVRQQLAGEHRRLEAERQIEATSLRVDRTARERLGMHPITPALTLFADAGVAAPMPASAPSAAAPRSLR